jgi:Flp pilus assembly protein TadG
MTTRHDVGYPSTAAKIFRALVLLRRDQTGTIAVMMALLFPALIAILGLGMEVTNWYMRTRAMQNAADAAVIAAATNGTANYNVEAAAVAANYGLVNGTDNVTVTATDAAACPADPSITPPCYKVTITRLVSLALTAVVGYKGNVVVDGVQEQQLSSSATATKTIIQQPICMLGLDTTGTAIRSNGGPNTDFTGCTVMSNSTGLCNGSNLKANMGLAHATNNGCGFIGHSNVPVLSDPYASMANNIRSDLNNFPTKCGNSYAQETKHGSTWSGGNTWGASGSTTTMALTGTDAAGATTANNRLVCGDLVLQGDVTIDAPSGAVLYIENGLLDLHGHTLKTASGSSVTIVFTGTNTGNFDHFPTDLTNGSNGVLDIQAPTGGPFPGMALYQDPILTQSAHLDFEYKGNSPTWNLTGGTYFPNAQVTISGTVNKSANGAQCFVMVAKDILINGNGSFYSQTPDGSGCKAAGLQVPTATIPGRVKLVY